MTQIPDGKPPPDEADSGVIGAAETALSESRPSGRREKMIESEAQKAAALSWIAYWKRGRAAGDQSWLANEQALGEIMLLRGRIDAYTQRLAAQARHNHVPE